MLFRSWPGAACKDGAQRFGGEMSALQGQTVLVLGLGESGLAMARWCAAQGAAVRVWDSREAPPQAAALHEALPQAQLLGGALGEAALEGVHRVLKSPGLAPGDERIAALLAAAHARGTAVQGELALFVEALAEKVEVAERGVDVRRVDRQPGEVRERHVGGGQHGFQIVERGGELGAHVFRMLRCAGGIDGGLPGDDQLAGRAGDQFGLVVAEGEGPGPGIDGSALHGGLVAVGHEAG